MARRGVQLDTIYPVCKRLDEDSGRIFFKCKLARIYWRLLNMENIRSVLVCCQSGLEVLAKIWELQKNMQLKVFVFLWRCWLARNKANDGEKMLTAAEVPRWLRGWWGSLLQSFCDSRAGPRAR